MRTGSISRKRRHPESCAVMPGKAEGSTDRTVLAATPGDAARDDHKTDLHAMARLTRIPGWDQVETRGIPTRDDQPRSPIQRTSFLREINRS